MLMTESIVLAVSILSSPIRSGYVRPSFSRTSRSAAIIIRRGSVSAKFT